MNNRRPKQAAAASNAALPKEWTTLRIGDMFSRRVEPGRPGLPVMSIVMQRGLVERESVDRRVESNLAPAGHLLVRSGDLAYNMMRMWQGVLGRGEFDCMVSPAYIVLQPNGKVDSRFAEYLFSTERAIAKFKRLSYGVVDDRLRLYYRDLIRITFAVPDNPDLQRRIAEYVSLLNEAIAQTSALAAKSRNMHRGLVDDVFSRGVTAEGIMRPPSSEAPRLYRSSATGPIPLEWTPSSLSSLLLGKPKNGFSPPEADQWCGLWSLGLGCLTEEGFKPKQLKMVSPAAGACAEARLADGDLLISRSNTPALVGLAGVYRDVGNPCIYPDLMMRLRPNSRTKGDFLEALLLSRGMRNRIGRAAIGTSGSMVKLNSRSVLSLPVAIPESDEQERILTILNASRERLDALTNQLSKLRQLKAGLMDDLITGRVQVKLAEAATT